MHGFGGARIVAAAGLLVVAGCAHVAEPSAQERWQGIAQGLDVMARCPERVWPGYRWAGHRLVFYDRVQKTARFWRLPGSGGTPQTGELPFAELTEAATTGTFDASELAGETSLFVSLDDTAELNRKRREEAPADHASDAALEYAFHESFHQIAQRAWPARTGAEGGAFARADPFPLRWRPRYLRLQLLRGLQDALRGKLELSAAAYWFELYRAEAPAESAAVVPLEVNEGSAQYVEGVSGWLARDGCEVSQANLQRTAVDEVDRISPYVPRVAMESYSLGAVAILLIRARNLPGWQQRVEGGESPVRMLLEGIEPVPQPDDARRAEKIQAVIDANNRQLSGDLAPFRTAYSSDVIRVGLGGLELVGIMQAEEPVQWMELSGEPVVSSWYTATLSGAGGARVALQGAQPFFSASSPCGPKALTLLIPADDLHEQGGVFSAKTPSIDLSNLSASRVEHEGARWICAQDHVQAD